MASINPLARELVLKIVFYGPGLGGKTTTLQHIHDMAKPEHRGKMVSLATAVDRTLYFDFLPLRIPKTKGFNIRLQLFTVPGQVYYNSTRKLVLTGVDGLIFVADSQAARQDANLESLENLVGNLREQKRDLSKVPHVFLYNKRDLEDILPLEEMDRELNLLQATSVPTIATQGQGVFQGLARLIRAILATVQSTLPADSGPVDLPTDISEETLATALQNNQLNRSPRGTVVVTQNVLEVPEPRWSDAPVLPKDPAVPDSTPGAIQTARPASQELSFAALWSEEERNKILEIERNIANGERLRALEGMDLVVSRIFASTGALLRTNEAPREPSLIPVLLGINGPRYLGFRAQLRDARAGMLPDERNLLAAYAFVIEVRLARDRFGL